MTLAKNVERHIQDVKSRGFNVDVESLISSKHVTHARTDPERYWGAVQRVWEKAKLDPEWYDLLLFSSRQQIFKSDVAASLEKRPQRVL
ncbi:hypothetical protein FISHEDRAFT_78895 [Fistulina hepatica ATCC 64428]|uniref:Uncharacterized protein n=1 Tax=Fistulina hepatica ATCC 64428 TaxID=1128425 RepID=A0A0D6ZZR9_9AGAR|nr:hypothetical protein FISHEDRAFT_78895 [Fistulina hepatica ATCC 64428]